MCPLLGFEGSGRNFVAARPCIQGYIAQCIITGLENNFYYTPKCGTAQIAASGMLYLEIKVDDIVVMNNIILAEPILII